MPRSHKESLALLEQIRWNGQPTCPYCGSTKSSSYKNQHRYHCTSCFTSYSVTVGTLFHKTHVDLQKWFQAIHIIMRASPHISVRKLSKEIGVSKNTASYMISRIRRAMIEELDLLHKIAELDES
jgi:transposase-like protein